MNGIPEEIMTAPNCAVFESIPDRFLDCPAERLAELLPGPCLMDLPGRERRPLFVSVLLHGNEDTGLAAAQEVLRRHLSRELHRSLLLFVGNVAAAAANVRTLPGQADYNRVWPGTPTPDIPEAHMARWVFDYAASRRPFASIEAQNWALALAVGAHSRGPDGDEGWRQLKRCAGGGDQAAARRHSRHGVHQDPPSSLNTGQQFREGNRLDEVVIAASAPRLSGSCCAPV
jgi:Succinylglutamate desuccinylase / Aspartoacylase family